MGSKVERLGDGAQAGIGDWVRCAGVLRLVFWRDAPAVRVVCFGCVARLCFGVPRWRRAFVVLALRAGAVRLLRWRAFGFGVARQRCAPMVLALRAGVWRLQLALCTGVVRLLFWPRAPAMCAFIWRCAPALGAFCFGVVRPCLASFQCCWRIGALDTRVGGHSSCAPPLCAFRFGAGRRRFQPLVLAPCAVAMRLSFWRCAPLFWRCAPAFCTF